jgi:F-type H+-transporting ATPase subunit delta
MNEEIIASRYAQALFDLAVKHGNVEQAGEALAGIAEMAFSDKAMLNFWKSPLVERARKSAALAAIVKKTGTDGFLAAGLDYLLEKDRLALLKYIARSFRRLAERHLKLLTVRLTTVRPLPPEKMENIRRVLREKTGRTIKLDNTQDPCILGGVVMRVENTLLDGSVRGQLERLKRELAG